MILHTPSIVYNRDCLEAMREMEDNAHGLAIIDPPYGININHNIGRRAGDKHSGHKKAYWDNCSPSVEFFNELFRVSENQIIWGANHFISKMPIDSSCWLMWDKGFSEDLSFAQFELAWTSFKGTCKKYDRRLPDDKRIHPTQKPVALYDWLIHNYAKDCKSILDTHTGSGSSRIAAYKSKIPFTGFELDPDYHKAAEQRFRNHASQLTMF